MKKPTLCYCCSLMWLAFRPSFSCDMLFLMYFVLDLARFMPFFSQQEKKQDENLPVIVFRREKCLRVWFSCSFRFQTLVCCMEPLRFLWITPKKRESKALIFLYPLSFSPLTPKASPSHFHSYSLVILLPLFCLLFFGTTRRDTQNHPKVIKCQNIRNSNGVAVVASKKERQRQET